MIRVANAPIRETAPLSRGLLGAWLLDEGAGTQIIDSSRRQNHASITGTLSWSDHSEGHALEFDGDADNRVVVGNLAAFNVPRLTVAAWVRVDTWATLRTAVSRWDATNKNWLLGCGANTDTYRFGVYVNNVFYAVESSPTIFAAGERVLLAGTYDGQYVRTYVNHREYTASWSTPGTVDTDPVALQIGGRAALSDANTWTGGIDTVLMWDYPLTHDALLALLHDPSQILERPKFYLVFTGATPALSASCNVARQTHTALPVTGYVPSFGTCGIAAQRHVALPVVGYVEQDTTIAAFSETFDVLQAEVEDEEGVVHFEIGKYNLFKLKVPHERWFDARCNFPYREVGTCHYGMEEFAGATRIDLKAAGDGDTGIQGWVAQNFGQATTADIDVTASSHMTVEIPGAVDTTWSVIRKDAPYLYRVITASDFDVSISLDGNPNEIFESEGMLVAKDSDPNTVWLHYRHQYDGAQLVVLASMSGNGSIENLLFSTPSTHTFLRLQKVGQLFNFYSKAVESGSWVILFSTIITELDAVDVRMGPVVETSSATRTSPFTAQFDYFRMTAGGLASCDHTLDGPTGCRAHSNTRRFGGAPGIIHGPIAL